MAGIHQTLREARSLYAEALKLQEAVLASHRDLEGCVAQIRDYFPGGNQAAALTLHGLFSHSTQTSPANPTDQIVAHTLGFSSSAVNLSRIFFEQLHPILDIGRGALWVMPHADAITRHHGADLGPQFFAGILERSKPLLHPVFKRVPIHAIRVAGRVGAFMQRHLVVTVSDEGLTVKQEIKAIDDAMTQKDREFLARYGGFGGAMQRSAALQRLPQAKVTEGVSVDDYSTWRSAESPGRCSRRATLTFGRKQAQDLAGLACSRATEAPKRCDSKGDFIIPSEA